MLKKARYGAVACTLLAPALLSACGAPQPATTANSQALKPPRVFTLDTPVERIAADPDGKAILERDIPGVMASKEYPMFDDMSLTQIALMSGGRLSQSKLDLVQTDLVQLSSLSN
jgi:hypothetical protein